MADSLSRNVPVGTISVHTKDTTNTKTLHNFSVHEQVCAQRQHSVWSKVIHHLESSDEVSLLDLHTTLSQFLLDGDGVLCRYWPNKQYPVTQL